MKTGIYVRVSTEEQVQEGFSIRAQEDKLKSFAQIKDWSIFKNYIDEGISGKNIKDRPAIKEMLEDIENGSVKNVLVFKIDRLTRSTADLIYLVDLFNKYDCAFNSLMESIDTKTASGRMFLKIIGIFAEFERENIIERTKLGNERKVKEGYSLCGRTVSYGYDRPKSQKIQTINEQEAEIVREIFDLFVNQGNSLNAIAKMMNMRKVPTKLGRPWSHTQIRKVLTNCNYIGNVRHHMNDKRMYYSVEGLHEQIVSQELFDAAQRVIAKNQKISPRKKPNDDKYFSGLLVCAKCGYKLRTYNISRKLKDGEVSRPSGYVCKNRFMKACDASCMSHRKVEQAFDDYISNIAKFDVADEIRQVEQEKSRQDNLMLIQDYEAKYRQLVGKEREVLCLYVDNDIDFDSYRGIKAQVDKDKQIIHSELERLREINEDVSIKHEDIIAKLNENWALLSNEERRQFLIQFIEKIVIVNEKKDEEYFGTVKIIDVVFKSV